MNTEARKFKKFLASWLVVQREMYDSWRRGLHFEIGHMQYLKQELICVVLVLMLPLGFG